ncbi:MAG: hypothetical protein A2138_15315 [Deltaproteobacteria bacterium RBG_16_71_12]|nr:MAG: hypothetical protein A2138_15315 [Deltaproteobacteria bacterium RBG_16_71_12]
MARSVTAIDTNILLYGLNAHAPEHAKARAFMEASQDDPDFVLSELILVELYVLLRNPAVMSVAQQADVAASIVEELRKHPTWQLVDHDTEVMGEVWKRAKTLSVRNRIFDVRLALGLRRHGVTRFATRNIRDFQGFGFDEVFDPIGST